VVWACLLAVVAPAAGRGADPASLLVTAAALDAVHDGAFILGPGSLPAGLWLVARGFRPQAVTGLGTVDLIRGGTTT
jgi:hypothetical protein